MRHRPRLPPTFSRRLARLRAGPRHGRLPLAQGRRRRRPALRGMGGVRRVHVQHNVQRLLCPRRRRALPRRGAPRADQRFVRRDHGVGPAEGGDHGPHAVPQGGPRPLHRRGRRQLRSDGLLVAQCRRARRAQRRRHRYRGHEQKRRHRLQSDAVAGLRRAGRVAAVGGPEGGGGEFEGPRGGTLLCRRAGGVEESEPGCKERACDLHGTSSRRRKSVPFHAIS